MASRVPQFDLDLCMACRICVDSCPVSCITLAPTGQDRYNKAYPELASQDSCTSCGLCVRGCPVDAVSMFDVS